MHDREPGAGPSRIKVQDKRRNASFPQEEAAARARDEAAQASAQGAPGAPQSSSQKGASSGSQDAPGHGAADAADNSASASAGESDSRPEGEPGRKDAPDYLDDLRRLQAEFDNYRKRMMKEQTAIAGRATARIIEQLLPVLDNFERALSHGEAGPGVEMAVKELKGTLSREGLQEIAAEGEIFDPEVHEAVESRPHPGSDAHTVISVYRRGYRMGDKVIRPAMVVVSRPSEDDSGPSAGDDEAGPNAAEA